MIFYRKLSMIGRAFIIVLLTLTFSGCDMLEGIAIGTSTEEVTAQGDVAQLKLVVPKYLPWLPWFLAAKEDVFQQYSEEYHVDITFEEADYEGAINKFVSREADAVVVTNIDGISKIATRGIEVDVILISSYSQGNDALLIPAENDANLKIKTLPWNPAQQPIIYWIAIYYVIKLILMKSVFQIHLSWI